MNPTTDHGDTFELMESSTGVLSVGGLEQFGAVMLTEDTADLARAVVRVADARDALDELDGRVRAELARRLDADNTRKAPLADENGEVIGELEVNAPDVEEYDPDALLAELHDLAGEGVLTPTAVDRAVPYPAPKPPLRRVDKRELAKLKKHPDRRVGQAIARVRRIVPTARKVKVTLTDA